MILQFRMNIILLFTGITNKNNAVAQRVALGIGILFRKPETHRTSNRNILFGAAHKGISEW